MPGPEAEHTTCLNRRGRFAGGARKLIIGGPTFGGWPKCHFLVDFGWPLFAHFLVGGGGVGGGEKVVILPLI